MYAHSPKRPSTTTTGSIGWQAASSNANTSSTSIELADHGGPSCHAIIHAALSFFFRRPGSTGEPLMDQFLVSAGRDWSRQHDAAARSRRGRRAAAKGRAPSRRGSQSLDVARFHAGNLAGR